MLTRRSTLLSALVLSSLTLAGCGHDETVTVGKGEPKGVIRRDIDTARSTASQATDKIRSGEKDVYGG